MHCPSITTAHHIPITLKPTDMSPVDRCLNTVSLLANRLSYCYDIHIDSYNHMALADSETGFPTL